jgi:hypothetical protein
LVGRGWTYHSLNNALAISALDEPVLAKPALGKVFQKKQKALHRCLASKGFRLRLASFRQ